MSEVKTMNDYLKSLPTAPSLSGLSMLLVNSSGEPQKRSATAILPYTRYFAPIDLNELTAEGIYQLGGSGDIHGPDGCNTAGCLMFVVKRAEGYLSQVILPTMWSLGMYYRIMSNSKWESWFRIVGTAVATHSQET